jgi:hypothetical protein
MVVRDVCPRCQSPKYKKNQIPPDLVVKFQAIDIAEVILWLGLWLRVVYQQEIKG